MFIATAISYTVRPSHNRPMPKWVGMVISGALWIVWIAFLTKVILHGATRGSEHVADAIMII